MLTGLVLAAALASCGSRPAGTHPGGPAVTPPTPAASASPAAVTVTEAASGRVVRLRVGQRLRVVLGAGGGQWNLPVSTGRALRRVVATGGYPSTRPADAFFLAVAAGRASVRSVTDYRCLHSKPVCAIAQRVWSIRVVVT